MHFSIFQLQNNFILLQNPTVLLMVFINVLKTELVIESKKLSIHGLMVEPVTS